MHPIKRDTAKTQCAIMQETLFRVPKFQTLRVLRATSSLIAVVLLEIGEAGE